MLASIPLGIYGLFNVPPAETMRHRPNA